jgi:hypothetical protein
MIDMFLRNGEPNSSVMIIEMKERKPRPMNSGEPQLNNIVSPSNISTAK